MSEDRDQHNIELEIEARELGWPHAAIVAVIVAGTLGALWIICNGAVAIFNG